MTGWLVEALVASAVLMALVLVIRVPVRRLFGPQVAYMLWALPPLRVILPPIPALWRVHAPTPITRAGDTLVLIVRPSAAGAGIVGTAPLVTAGALLGLVWAAGAALFLAYHLVSHRRFYRRIVAQASSVEIIDGIRVITSAAAAGPLAFGVWRQCIAFPIDMADRYDADERALALAHEIGHHRRGDLVANWAALCVLALHWFSPLAWRAFRAFRVDQELANDAQVLASRSVTERRVYARAIVKTVQGGVVSAACQLHSVADLKGRLKMLSLSPASRRRLVSGAAAVGMLAAVGLGLTASRSSAAAEGRSPVPPVAHAAMPEMPSMSETPEMQSVSPPDAPTPPAPHVVPRPAMQARTIIVRPGKDEPITMVTQRGTGASRPTA